MSDYRFEFCTEETVERLIEFIDVYWQKNHILVQSRELFDWQHKAGDGEYNFALAISNKTNEICGIQGFIPSGHFSKDLEDNNETWLAIWKVRDDIKAPGLGAAILKFIRKRYKTVCALGLNKLVLPFYATFKYQVGVLNHHVLINNECQNFSILQPGVWKKIELYHPITGYELVEQTIETISKLNIRSEKNVFFTKPLKDVNFLINRYLRHPIYDYKVYAISEDDLISGFLVTRHVSLKNSTIIRVIDYQGSFDHLSKLYNPLIKILKKYDAEYIDFMQFGIPVTFLQKAGFIDVFEYQDMVVPDYFEPFVNTNIVIDFAYKTKNPEPNFFICKGDGDQDRPSSIGVIS